MFNIILNYCINNALQIASILVPVIVAIWIFFKQNKKRELSITEWYDGKIIDSKNKFLENKISVSFENKELNDLSVIIFEFKNTGNEVVDKTDFIDHKPIEIHFGETTVVSYNIKDITPEILKDEIKIEIKDGKLSILPFSINVKDGFLLEVFIGGELTDYKINQRIKGISKIAKNNHYKKRILYLISIFFSTLLLQYLMTTNKAIKENITFLDALKMTNDFANPYLQGLSYIMIFIVFYLFYKVLRIEFKQDNLRGKKRRRLREVFKLLSR